MSPACAASAHTHNEGRSARVPAAAASMLHVRVPPSNSARSAHGLADDNNLDDSHCTADPYIQGIDLAGSGHNTVATAQCIALALRGDGRKASFPLTSGAPGGNASSQMCCHFVRPSRPDPMFIRQQAEVWQRFLHKPRGRRSVLQMVLLRDPIDRLVSQYHYTNPLSGVPSAETAVRWADTYIPKLSDDWGPYGFLASPCDQYVPVRLCSQEMFGCPSNGPSNGLMCALMPRAAWLSLAWWLARCHMDRTKLTLDRACICVGGVDPP